MPAASAALQRLRRLVTAIQAKAVDAEHRVTAAAAADSIAVALDRLVGIGPVLALTIRAEIVDIARFRRGAELASYVGLVPRVDAGADRYLHRADHAPRVRVVTVGAGGSRDTRDPTARRPGTLGPAVGGPEGRRHSARRARPPVV